MALRIGLRGAAFDGGLPQFVVAHRLDEALRLAERLSRGELALNQLPIEVLHKQSSGEFVDSPVAYQNRRRAGVQKGPGQSDQFITAQDLAATCLAGAQAHQLRVEAQILN